MKHSVKSRLNKIGPYILLLACMIVLSIYFYRDTIHTFPSHIHAWTQSDRYALALGFVENDLDFFLPQTYNLNTEHGITAADFPLNEWMVAVIMKMTGSTSPAIFRWYVLVYSFLGYLFLFRLVYSFSGSRVKGLFMTLFVFTCPIIVYYQAGFIPSSTALANFFIGSYFYFTYLRNRKISGFYWAVGFFTLAVLTRTPFNIYLFAILLERIRGWVKDKKVNRKEFVILTIAYMVVVGYSFYKSYLAEMYGSAFLGTILPARSFREFTEIVGSVLDHWTFQLFTKYHYFVLAVPLYFLSFKTRLFTKVPDTIKPLMQHSVLILAGGGVYFLLMARQYVHHEYYFMDSFYPGVILFAIAAIVSVRFRGVVINSVLCLLMVVILLGAAHASRQVQQVKYTDQPGDRTDVERRAFEGGAALLEQLQVPTDAKVLVLDAYSTNIPLLLLNKKGYTVMGPDSTKIAEALMFPFDYLVQQDQFLLSDVLFYYPDLKRHLERVGGNGKISVFKVVPEQINQNLAALMGLGNPLETQVLVADESKSVKDHEEFGPSKEFPVNTPFNRLLFEGTFQSTDETIFKVACSIHHEGEVWYYRDYKVELSPKSGQDYSCLFLLPDDVSTGAKVKCYIWNPDDQQFTVDGATVSTYQFRQP